MTFLLDNLTAIIVGTVLLGALLVLQQRSQQSAVEAVERNRAQRMASELAHTLQREVENARGRDETERVFDVSLGPEALSGDGYRFRLTQATASDGTVYTSTLSFPTLLDPDRGLASPIGIVSYEVVETGQTTRVDGRERPLLAVRRFVFPRGGPLTLGGTYERIVDFDVTAFEPDGTEVTARQEIAETPVRIHFEIRYAPELARQRSGDQAAPEVASIRFARTARIPASTAYEAGGTIVADTPGGIPPLPGDDDYDGDDYDGDDSDGDSGTGTPPSDPDDPRDGPYDPADWGDDERAEDDKIIVCRDGKSKDIKLKDLRKHLEDGYVRGECYPAEDGAPPDEDDKVTICHKPGDKDETKLVKYKDLAKYLLDGDYLGECRPSGTPPPPPPPPPPCDDPKDLRLVDGRWVCIDD